MTDAVDTVVNWWATQIEQRTYGDPKIDGFAGIVAEMTHNSIQRNITVTAAQLNTFRAELRKEIDANPYTPCMVDYTPTIPLASALQSAGIPAETLGGKIKTRIVGGMAYAAVGYRAEYEAI